jgi:hypothetical protein
VFSIRSAIGNRKLTGKATTMRSKTPTQLPSFRLHTYLLPKASPSLKHISTRRTNGHCLGTFKTGRKMFLPPNPLKCSVSHRFLFSLSLFQINTNSENQNSATPLPTFYYSAVQRFYILRCIWLMVVEARAPCGDCNNNNNNNNNKVILIVILIKIITDGNLTLTKRLI